MRVAFIGKQSILKIVLIFFAFLCFYFSGRAQNGFASLTKTQFKLDTSEYTGYKSYFEYPSQQVLRAFWTYTKSFGHAENRRTYYLVSVPPQSDSTNVTITLAGKAEEEGSTSQFSLGMDLNQYNQDPKSYQQQLRIMLLEFKVDMYMGVYQDQINTLSYEAKKLSKKHQKALKKGEIFQEENSARLSRLKDLEHQISQLRNQQVDLLSLLQKAKG